jgi:Amt family ammonium transporter
MDAVSTGDTAWVLTSTALVMMMVPALAFFYGGMVRRKNVLSTLNLSVILMGVLSLQWIIYGFSAFGNDIAGLIGGLNYLGLRGVGQEPNPDYAATIPFIAFAAFQMMFAVITPALITGAFVERVRFKAFLLFSILWATLVYDPVAHWVWGSVASCATWKHGLRRRHGRHITAGFSALAFALVIRKAPSAGIMEPNNIPSPC